MKETEAQQNTASKPFARNRVVGYFRNSSAVDILARMEEETYSISSIMDHAESLNLSIVTMVSDSVSERSLEDRTGYMLGISYIVSGLADVMIVGSMAEISSSYSEVAKMMGEFLRAGKRLICIKECFDTNDSRGQLLALTMSKRDSQNKSNLSYLAMKGEI